MKLILHLLDDNQPTGPRIARIDQWSGRAICMPRGAVDELNKRKELDGACVYFLVAQAGAGTRPTVYVGEADGFLSRVKRHLDTKSWWTALVAFVSADGSLTKSGIQYLESRCVSMLRQAGWCDLQNANEPTLPSVPEEDIGGLELFLNNIRIVMPVLGYNIFAEAPAADAGPEEVATEIQATATERPFDTIVCPARDDGFEYAFLGQRAWWAIRIGQASLPKIKYIAMYRVAPISAITHYGEVARIERYVGDGGATGKYKLTLKGEPIALANPIGLGGSSVLKLQAPRYALLADILKAKSLDAVFA